MSGGSHPPAAQSLTASFFGSTGVKMFLILTLALLPLGLIAFVASLQAIQTADLEKEALLRVAVSQSARKLTADLESDRTALQLTVNNLSTTPSDTGICARLQLFLASKADDMPSMIALADACARRTPRKRQSSTRPNASLVPRRNCSIKPPISWCASAAATGRSSGSSIIPGRILNGRLTRRPRFRIGG